MYDEIYSFYNESLHSKMTNIRLKYVNYLLSCKKGMTTPQMEYTMVAAYGTLVSKTYTMNTLMF